MKILAELKSVKKIKYLKILFLAAVVVWFCFWAFHIVTNLSSASSGPDEQLRMLVPTYIYTHHQLPNGYDPEVIYPTGNWSYAFYPQLLGAIASAGFISIVSLFNSTPDALIIGARLASVLFGVITVFIFGLIIKKLLAGYKYAELYSYIGMVFIAFWPQFAFLSSYVNNDIVALSGVSIIVYACILGMKDGWAKRNSILLGLGFAICLLGYTNSYGFILFGGLFYLVTVWRQYVLKHGKKLRTSLIFVCLLPVIIAGPFFIRNAVLYNGDFLGLHTFKSRTLEWEAVNNQKVQTSYFEEGNRFVHYFRDTKYWTQERDSFIGTFGYMTIVPGGHLLFVYKAVTSIGAVGFLWMLIDLVRKQKYQRYKKELFLGLILICASLTTLGLAIYYSLKIDAQPQGRYIIYLLIPLLMSTTIGYWYISVVSNSKLYRFFALGICGGVVVLYILNSIGIFKDYIL